MWKPSTGCVRPETLKIGAETLEGRLKYFWNLTAMRVADMTMILTAGRLLATPFSRPMRISMARVRLWASSRRMVEYHSGLGSFMASRRSMPSAMYLRGVVPGSVVSWERIE